MCIPLRLDRYAMIVILQESPDGHYTINHASRVFADGRIEQLGWPRLKATTAAPPATRSARSCT